jgi:methionyl-tRNA synthetase
VPLPRQIFGHGWVHLKGEKMSKSAGTTVEPLDALGRFGSDPLRLYLVKEISFGSDGDFTWDRYEERYNVDLANNLGNLVSRLGAMAEKYRAGRLLPGRGPGPLADVARRTVEAYRLAMDAFALEGGAAAVFSLVDATNEYIAATEPWALARDPSNSNQLTQVLFDVAETLRIAAVLLLPIMPQSAREILRRVGETRRVEDLRLDDARWRSDGERALIKGEQLWPRTQTPESRPFEELRAGPSPRLRQGSGGQAEPPTSDRSKHVEKPEPSSAVPPAQPAAASQPAAPPAASSQPQASAGERISIDDFMKVDLRVAKVLAAEKVENSRKLVKLSIDVGTEQRTLVAGIAEAYEPEQLVGRIIVMVFNLKPAKLMGIESNGMVLAASPDGGKPTLVGFDQDVAPGTRVR